MLIALEGTDGSGKSTLGARLVSEAIDRRMTGEMIHTGPPRPMTPVIRQYTRSLIADRERILDPDHLVVLDRWHLGELIYGPLLRGGSRLSEPQLAFIERLMDGLGALRVVVTATGPEIRARFATRRRVDDLVTATMATELNVTYLSLARRLRWRITHPADHSDLPRELLRDATVLTNEARRLVPYPGYVGPPIPGVLLVGDVPNGWHPGAGSWPAFYPGTNASTSSYLLGALNAIDSPVTYGLCNANDDTPLEALVATLNPLVVVGLGRNAQRTLTRLKIDHVEAPHPQWVRRFHHGDREAYARSLLHPDLTLRWTSGDTLVTTAGTTPRG